MPLTDREVREHVWRVDSMLERVEAIEDTSVRETALAAIRSLLDLYGEGLARIVGHASTACVRSGDTALADALVADELISHLLVLHGLHPQDVEDRVRGALNEVSPYIHSHGGNVELVGVKNGVVQLRLEGSCKGCPSSSLTLRTAVEDAIRAAAPEILRIEADGVVELRERASEPALVPLTHSRPHHAERSAAGSLASEVA